MLGVGENLARAAQFDDLARVHHGKPVREMAHSDMSWVTKMAANQVFCCSSLICSISDR
jgi:hypothetical protein